MGKVEGAGNWRISLKEVVHWDQTGPLCHVQVRAVHRAPMSFNVYENMFMKNIPPHWRLNKWLALAPQENSASHLQVGFSIRSFTLPLNEPVNWVPECKLKVVFPSSHSWVHHKCSLPHREHALSSSRAVLVVPAPHGHHASEDTTHASPVAHGSNLLNLLSKRIAHSLLFI